MSIGIEWITLLIFGSMVLVMFMGLPVAFATGIVGIIFTAIFQGPAAVNMVPTRIFGLMTNYLLDAIPLFILMANMLERSGIIEDIYRWSTTGSAGPRAASPRQPSAPAR